ncbi:MAG: ribonuclease J, partial [Thermococcus sp.]|nr:ribonuclease J [Thermococcus sp.]
MKITVYDGADSIGGNKIHVLENNNGIFLDFGMNFAKYSLYYQDFIGERPARGIYDLWRLGLIPRLNIYREDLLPKDIESEISMHPKIPVNAVLISHAHLDHVGNIALLSKNIPMVGSLVTMMILKALRDTGHGSHLGMEIPYYSPKQRKKGNPSVLESKSKKGEPYKWRAVLLTESPNQESIEFLQKRIEEDLGKNVKPIEKGRIDEISGADIGFEIEAYPVDHSILGATAYIVEGDTTLAYTGDFRLHGNHADSTQRFIKAAKLHGNHADSTQRFIKAAKSASILITEGTRVGRDEEGNVSEKEVYLNAKKIAEDSKGLVIADFSARNFERLETFKRIAKEVGRELVITSKDAYFLYALELATGNEYLNNVGIYENPRSSLRGWEQWVMERYEELKVPPEELRHDPDNYVLCFSFYDLPHLLDVNPKGGVYIYSSSEAFGEEQEFSFLRLWNWLQYFGFEVYGFRLDNNGKPVFEKSLHASGHVSRE